jgi:hypothetical protein
MFKTGDVVVLKSGGDAMTIESTKGKEAKVVWMGEEGELFRDTLPFAVLMAAEFDEEDEEEEDEEEEEEEEEEEGDEPSEDEESEEEEASEDDEKEAV